MGKSCSIEDIVLFYENENSILDLNKIGALTYINKILIEIDRYFSDLYEDDEENEESTLCFDIILEYLQRNLNYCNFLLFYVILKKEVDEVPDYILTLIECNDDDIKYDLFVKFLNDNNI